MTTALLTRSLQCSRPVRHIVIVAVLAAVYSPANSWADAIQLTSHTSIRVFGVVTATIPSSPFDARNVLGDFADSSDSLGPVTLSRAISDCCSDQIVGGSSAATITNLVLPSTIRVSGSTTTTAHAGQLSPGSLVRSFDIDTRAFATVDASFTLTDPHLFDTTLTQDVSQHGFGLATLVERTRGEIFRRGIDFFGFVGPFDEFGALMGTLAPGDYRLSVAVSSFAFARSTDRSSASDSGRSDIDLGFTLTPAAPTPEPTSVILLGTGFLGLVARTWRQRRRSCSR